NAQLGAPRAFRIARGFCNFNRALKQPFRGWIITQSRERDSMRGQRFGQDCLLVTFLQCVYSVSSHALGFSNATFGQQGSRASVVNLGDHAHVTQRKKETASAVKMSVGFVRFSNREEQITEIVFHSSEIAGVSSQFK